MDTAEEHATDDRLLGTTWPQAHSYNSLYARQNRGFARITCFSQVAKFHLFILWSIPTPDTSHNKPNPQFAVAVQCSVGDRRKHNPGAMQYWKVCLTSAQRTAQALSHTLTNGTHMTTADRYQNAWHRAKAGYCTRHCNRTHANCLLNRSNTLTWRQRFENMSLLCLVAVAGYESSRCRIVHSADGCQRVCFKKLSAMGHTSHCLHHLTMCYPRV